MVAKQIFYVSAAALLAIGVPERASAAPLQETLFQQSFGIWQVKCGKDAMTDQPTCTTSGSARGRGPFSETALSIIIASIRKGALFFGFQEPTFGWHVTRIAVKFDDNAPEQIACDEVKKDFCFFDGPQRTMLSTNLDKSSNLRIRLTILNGKSYDFTYDLAGYRDAEREFVRLQSQYLP